LVAGESENDELIGVFSGEEFVELLQAIELVCEATFGSGVDDEDDFAAVLG
jgi:hypothetical protein